MEATLLVELLTEELPPKSLRLLAQTFASMLGAELNKNGFVEELRSIDVFATPRRLAARIPAVRERSPDTEKDIQGPPITAAAQAIAGFAKKNGIAIEALKKQQGPKGEIYVAHVSVKGQALADVLATRVEAALKSLPIPKVMRWGSGEAQFVRPVHGLVMLHGSRVVPGSVLGLQSGSKTRGHRFMGKSDITLANADEYEKKLLDEGMVLADFGKRKSEIDRQLQAEAKKQNASLGEYQVLLDEVTALVEHPSVYVGEFDRAYLEVPQECLILTMRQNQKYFPLFDAEGKLTGKFLIVSNMQVADARHIIGGNQRVVRPRLEDARFFYDQDRKQRLEERVPLLAKVVYHNKLGSQLDRVQRVKLLAGNIARALGADAMQAERAAELAKADLLTGMVGEFPELQGVMGRYYAMHDKESQAVADAVEEHYRPRFAGDILPRDLVACSLALADKLETISGMFGIGQQPTGDKDPFGLRRAALGITRILIERKIELSLKPLVDSAIEGMPNNAKSDWLVVDEFLLDRARSYFIEQGITAKAIEGVLAPFGHVSPLYILSGMVSEASHFLSTEEGKILADANKRITNILKKSGFEVPFGVGPDDLPQKPNTMLFEGKAEIEFWSALQKIGGESLILKRKQNFAQSLRVLSQLGKPTKTFFDTVLVNAENLEVRDNRINLLQHARAYMNQVADLSLMAS